MVVWMSCLVASGQVEVRLKALDELGQPVAGAFAVGGSIHPGIPETDAKGERPCRASKEVIVGRKDFTL